MKYIDRDEIFILLMYYFIKFLFDYFKWYGRWNGIYYFLKGNVSDMSYLLLYSIFEGKGNYEF